MTNEQIIYTARMKLAADGVLAVENGEPEEIHTYRAWKQLGFQVLKGEHAVCKLSIWKPVQKKNQKPADDGAGDEGDTPPAPYMIPKVAAFFSRSQVDSII